MIVHYFDACPMCESDRLDPFSQDAWDETRLHVSQVRCRSCGLLISQPQAGPDQMAEYYERVHYETMNTDPEENFATNRRFYGESEFPLARRLWRDWPPPSNPRVLEVGCGYGGFLSALEAAGCDAIGTEMSPRCTTFCRSRNLAVVRATVPGLPFPPAIFDVVFSMHVIEHVADPARFVQELAGKLRPGGLLVLATENASCAQYEKQRLSARLAGRLPPFRTSHDHTFVFLGKHLKLLMERAGCDAVSTHVYHVAAKESLHWKAYKGLFRTIDRLTGQGDYLMAVGRRAISSNIHTTVT